MGGFVGHLSEAALRAAIDVVSDEALLKTAYVVESKGSLGALVATLPTRAPRVDHRDRRHARPLDRGARRPAPRRRGAARAARRHRRRPGRRGPRRDGQGGAEEPAVGGRPARDPRDEPRQPRPLRRAEGDPDAAGARLDRRRRLAPRAVGRAAAAPAAAAGPRAPHGRGARHGLRPQRPRADRRAPRTSAGSGDRCCSSATELERRTQLDLAKLLAATDDDELDGMLDAVWEERLEPELAHLAALLPTKDMAAFSERLDDPRRRGVRRGAARGGAGARARRAERGAGGMSTDRAFGAWPRDPRVSSATWRRRPRSSPPSMPTGRSGARSGWTSTGSSTCAGCASQDRWMNLVDIGEGPVVLMIHGLSGCWQNWLENIPFFARDHRVIAVDLPGFGESEMPVEKISISQLRRHDRRAARRARDRPAGAPRRQLDGRLHRRRARDPLPGAHRAARARRGRRPQRREHPHRSARRACATAPRTSPSSTSAGSRRARRPSRARPRLRSAVLLLVVAHPDRLPPALTFEQVKGSGKDGFNDALEALCNYPIRERLPEIECPTFIVWGDKDRLVPLKDASVFEELIADSRKVIYKDTGHLTMLERPARFNATSTRSCRSSPARRSRRSRARAPSRRDAADAYGPVGRSRVDGRRLARAPALGARRRARRQRRRHRLRAGRRVPARPRGLVAELAGEHPRDRARPPRRRARPAGLRRVADARADDLDARLRADARRAVRHARDRLGDARRQLDGRLRRRRVRDPLRRAGRAPLPRRRRRACRWSTCATSATAACGRGSRTTSSSARTGPRGEVRPRRAARAAAARAAAARRRPPRAAAGPR